MLLKIIKFSKKGLVKLIICLYAVCDHTKMYEISLCRRLFVSAELRAHCRLVRNLTKVVVATPQAGMTDTIKYQLLSVYSFIFTISIAFSKYFSSNL